ncbi:MAG TPA: prolipoprotein diacylglyceryl transferase [Pseudonocardiaceae bacterium]|nr:prolipoprotein diacylglyceryl transferase [Pseudonocardiaceae bacterium]
MIAAAGLAHSYIPSPDQGVWHLGPIPLRAYALCIIVGIVVAIAWGAARYRARGGQPGVISEIAVWAVPFGLVGGRAYHVATDAWRYFGRGGNPIGALEIWDGGLGIPGAIALGGLGAWIACRRRGIPLPFVADALAPAIVVAQAIGRIGNYFNQELYGGPTSLPWGLEIFTRVDPGTGALDNLGGVALSHANPQIVQPTFLYELIWDLIIALFVVIMDRRLRLGHGRAFALYVAGYAFGRFWIELLRTDPATHLFGVRINVWVMALLFIGGILYYLFAAKRGPREDPTTFPDAPTPPAAEGSAEPVPTEEPTEEEWSTVDDTVTVSAPQESQASQESQISRQSQASQESQASRQSQASRENQTSQAQS